MGLISKLKGKDKHEKEEDVSPVVTNSPNKSYYTGPQSDATPAGYGTDATPAPPTGPPGTNTTSGSHALGSDNNFGSNTTAGTHGQLNDSLSGGRHGPGSSDRYDSGHNSGRHGLGSDNNFGSNTTAGTHGQLNDTLSGGRHGPTSSSDYNNTPGAFPSSHTSDRRDHVDRDGYGPSGPGFGQDRHGGISSSSQNFSGRDPYNAREAPGPYGTRDDYAGDRGPASHTLGPHQSNAANVMDPRVRPEPEKMRDHHTVGPHQSDMMNKLDPRVTADPRAHGYSRDPRDAGYDSRDASGYESRDPRDRYDERASPPRQTGGFVGGPHERLENHGSIPTAGGIRPGGVDEDPYDRSGMGGRAADPYAPSSNDRYVAGHGGVSDRHAAPRGAPGAGGMSTTAEPRKMGGAFEAGYQTAMEHAKQEQQQAQRF